MGAGGGLADFHCPVRGFGDPRVCSIKLCVVSVRRLLAPVPRLAVSVRCLLPPGPLPGCRVPIVGGAVVAVGGSVGGSLDSMAN